MRMLALNAFGAPRIASASVRVRFAALANELARQRYDLIALTEVVFRWQKQVLEQQLLPLGYQVYPRITPWMVPGGLVVFSRLPIEALPMVRYQWHLNCLGCVAGFFGGDELLGKGFQVLRVSFGAATCYLVNTHLAPDYIFRPQPAEYSRHIMHQARQFATWVKAHISQGNLIIAGDFNFGPMSPACELIKTELGVRDVLAEISEVTLDTNNPNRRFAPRVHLQVDHVFYRLTNTTLTGKIVFKHPVGSSSVWVSDHYGIETLLLQR